MKKPGTAHNQTKVKLKNLNMHPFLRLQRRTHLFLGTGSLKFKTVTFILNMIDIWRTFLLFLSCFFEKLFFCEFCEFDVRNEA